MTAAIESVGGTPSSNPRHSTTGSCGYFLNDASVLLRSHIQNTEPRFD